MVSRSLDRPAVSVSVAAAGEGAAIAALGILALAGVASARSVIRPLAYAVDRYGGRIPLECGEGLCQTACADGETIGMVYTTPAVRWLESYPEDERSSLVRELAEVELLAVSGPRRGTGVGAMLLEHAEARVRAVGARFVVAKIRAGHFETMRWYRNRGYRIAAQGEPLLFTTTRGRPSSIGDGDDGYHLAVKPLRAGTMLQRRTSPCGSSCLVFATRS